MKYFEERKDEVRQWATRGYVELGDLLAGTKFDVEDLIALGVLARYEAILSTDLRTHIPVGEWAARFREGQYQTCFLSASDRLEMISLLDASPHVRERTRNR